MAQISSISNGEALSSVRTKLNDVITNVNLLDPTGWVDYSATSTIVGWSSTTVKIIRYRIIGKQLFYEVYLSGTSNNLNTTFTLPNSCVNIVSSSPIRITNNGTNAVGLFEISTSSSTVNCYTTVAGAAWTASGTKTVFISSFIEIA
jgi:hypothetical protein